MPDIGFGLWMTAAGMGTVFALLILLWGLLWLIGWIDQRSLRRAATQSVPAPAAVQVESAEEFSPDEIAAITVAVLAYTQADKPSRSLPPRVHEPGSHLFASRWVAAGRTFQHQLWTRGK
ncbi:MAG: OadG family protein [Propionibacteriaceae bacterium]|jgi:sodium pump decarboxylase gamma subunit|nr:OadG family protein [Propionibacteriaceae bacterium]